MNKQELAQYIDHTALKATVTADDIRKLCHEAIENGFISVCVNPCYVQLAADLLTGTPVKVCTVVGFPLGANQPLVKAFETENCVREGATEIDMVINVGAMKHGDYATVEAEIAEVVRAAKTTGGPHIVVKVIIETCYLTDEEKRVACIMAKKHGADFVKTSTGFGTGGATKEDIALMRATVGPAMGVKASGGVGDKATALKMVKAGATRLGASAGLKIIAG